MTKFSELGEFIAVPRVTSLRLSPDGKWIAAVVATLSADKKKYLNSIWRIDVGGASAERLTRSAEGEGEPAFLPDGSMLFVSSRPDPSAKPDDAGSSEKPALWSLPAGLGEAHRVTAPPGGVANVVAAKRAHSYLLSAPAFNGTKDRAEDAAKRKARADAGVSAILHVGDQARLWDSDLGPDCLRLLFGDASSGGHSAAGASAAATASETTAASKTVADSETVAGSDTAADSEADGDTRDLTPDPGRALDEQSFCLSPDGSLAVTGWQTAERSGGLRTELVVIDTATGNRRAAVSADGFDFTAPVISPDGRLLVAIRSEHDTYERPGDVTLVITALADLDSAHPRDLLPGFDRRPNEATFSADSATIYFTADDRGRCPIFAVDVASGQPIQITTDDAAYDNLCPAPDGQLVYALRSAVGDPPTPVRIDAAQPGTAPFQLQSPTGALDPPGQVRELSTTVTDGSTVRSWLVLPEGASPQAKVPLVLWVHGGPVMSWNSWSWRWNPWLLAARGYAVLMPDPALSSGYGHDFIARGYGTWGDKPYTDIMAITEAAATLPEIDSSKIAMMGGSFGGYMANWVAGQTGRFAAIVSHAGLWALDQMFGTTDGPFYWRREFGDPKLQPERYQVNSPHLHASAITAPVLIIHGDKDYRVPVGEALRMYSDLVGRGQQVKFLYFPDENHWILKPGDVAVWYETVFAFLAEHVLGGKWRRPELL